MHPPHKHIVLGKWVNVFIPQSFIQMLISWNSCLGLIIHFKRASFCSGHSPPLWSARWSTDTHSAAMYWHKCVSVYCEYVDSLKCSTIWSNAVGKQNTSWTISLSLWAACASAKSVDLQCFFSFKTAIIDFFFWATSLMYHPMNMSPLCWKTVAYLQVLQTRSNISINPELCFWLDSLVLGR